MIAKKVEMVATQVKLKIITLIAKFQSFVKKHKVILLKSLMILLIMGMIAKPNLCLAVEKGKTTIPAGKKLPSTTKVVLYHAAICAVSFYAAQIGTKPGILIMAIEIALIQKYGF